MALENLHDLMVEQLRDVYNAEGQIVKALPGLIEAASDLQLRTALQQHLTVTEKQVVRLEKIFGELSESPKGKKCKGMEGLLAEGKEVLGEDGEATVLDAAIIAAAQRVEHYEIAAYGTVLAYAREMNHRTIADLLEETLEEEKEADLTLTAIAQTGMNRMPLMNDDQRPLLDDVAADGPVNDVEEEALERPRNRPSKRQRRGSARQH